MFVSNCKFSCLVLSNLKVLSMHNISGLNYSDPSSVGLKDYRAWFKQHGNTIPDDLTDCDLEEEMQKVDILE